VRALREYRAERAAWREHRAALAEMDRALDGMEAAGVSPGSPEYAEAWNDRMSYAANCYPGAPALDLAGPEPEAQAEP